jgi:hypothetical protein
MPFGPSETKQRLQSILQTMIKGISSGDTIAKVICLVSIARLHEIRCTGRTHHIIFALLPKNSRGFLWRISPCNRDGCSRWPPMQRVYSLVPYLRADCGFTVGQPVSKQPTNDRTHVGDDWLGAVVCLVWVKAYPRHLRNGYSHSLLQLACRPTKSHWTHHGYLVTDDLFRNGSSQHRVRQRKAAAERKVAQRGRGIDDRMSVIFRDAYAIWTSIICKI